MRHIDTVGLAVEAMTGGTYFIQHDDGDHSAHLTEIHRLTVERPDRVESLWMVKAGEGDSEVTVAVTGNGPTSEANAKGIAHLMQAAPYLLNVWFAAQLLCERTPLDSDEGRRQSALRDALAPLLGEEESVTP